MVKPAVSSQDSECIGPDPEHRYVAINSTMNRCAKWRTYLTL